jgi:hypothetical protein
MIENACSVTSCLLTEHSNDPVDMLPGLVS